MNDRQKRDELWTAFLATLSFLFALIAFYVVIAITSGSVHAEKPIESKNATVPPVMNESLP